MAALVDDERIVFDDDAAASAIERRTQSLSQILNETDALRQDLTAELTTLTESSFSESSDIVAQEGERLCVIEQEVERLNADITAKKKELAAYSDVDQKIVEAQNRIAKLADDRSEVEERLASGGQAEVVISQLQEELGELVKRDQTTRKTLSDLEHDREVSHTIQSEIQELNDAIAQQKEDKIKSQNNLDAATANKQEIKERIVTVGDDLNAIKAKLEVIEQRAQSVKLLGKTLHEIQGLRSKLRLLGARMQEALGILYSIPSTDTPLEEDIPRLCVLCCASPGQQYQVEDWPEEGVKFKLVLLCAYDFTPVEITNDDGTPFTITLTRQDAVDMAGLIRISTWLLKTCCVAEMPVGDGLQLPVPDLEGFPSIQPNAPLNPELIEIVMGFWPSSSADFGLRVDANLREGNEAEVGSVVVTGVDTLRRLTGWVHDSLANTAMEFVTDKDGFSAWVKSDNVRRWQSSTASSRLSQLSPLLRRESAGHKFIARHKGRVQYHAKKGQTPGNVYYRSAYSPAKQR